MKRIFVYMAAALALAASCNKIEVANTPVPTETITVELNPQTKTVLNGKNTVWSAGDEVSVTVGGEKVGTLELVSGSTFSGEITAGLEGEAVATLNYGEETVPATQVAVAGSFANRAALLKGTTTVAALRAGTGATLQNQTALLQFQTPVAGDVAFTIGSTTYTVTGCKTGETYYACVDPANTGKLTYTVGIVLGGKEAASFTPVANKIHPLGTLTLKESNLFSLCGDPNGWGDTKFYETTQDNFFVYYGFKFTDQGKFKIRKPEVDWQDACNFGSANTKVKSKNTAIGVFTHGSSADITVASGTYDIYFDRLAGQVYLMESGKPYTEATKQTKPSTTYSLAGTFNGWGNKEMTYSGDGIWTVVQEFAKNAEWKIKQTANWNYTYTNVWVGWENKSEGSDGNVKMNNAGVYVMSFIENNQNNEKNIITLLQK